MPRSYTKVTPGGDPAAAATRKPAPAQKRPPPPDGIVAIDARARAAWPALAGVAFAQPGTIFQGPSGELLRIREDGGADELVAGGHPRAGIASDPCARAA